MAFLDAGMLHFEGDLCKNGDDAAQASFLKKFYQTYDRINKSTTLFQKYSNALEIARSNNKTQVDWKTSTALLKDMHIDRASYSAVLKWVVTALDDDGIKNSITRSECKELLDLSEEACGWRERQIDLYNQKSKADDGHIGAYKMWTNIRDKVEEVQKEVNEKGKGQFYSDNNNFKEYKNLFK
ncbi:uncharacterized protein LOC119071858 [Bradysia coprophila]|uniref:uncharacterized protein LOC119071858 n=1 Tax=Bradysia coprophila TaxID=38358 RepID=UPI00187D8455|nr:uncharacterized protein LOC119071858 [Bradysia coprophila]XP_037032815.1 uncharacterized protein LOC119071858 [Bradysia coprophila]